MSIAAGSDFTDHRVTLRVGIVLLGVGAASLIELLGRRGPRALPYAAAIVLLAAGAFIPLWLASFDAACPDIFESGLRCHTAFGSAVSMILLVLGVAMVPVGRRSRHPSHTAESAVAPV